MKPEIAQIFKAYDVRGKVGSELNNEVAEAIGRSLAIWLPERGSVAVGYDMRPDSAELAHALIKGITEQGRDVVIIGQVTSDMIYFATGFYDLAGGVVVTASHNPGEYNGIKLCREGAKPIGIDTGLAEIRDLTMSGQWPTPKLTGTISQQDPTEDWIKHVLSFVQDTKFKPLKVVVDAGNGMAGKIFAELEPYVPWHVTEMFFELDGTFPNHEANPQKLENLQDLIRQVKQEKADVGIAFDGDGDRAVLVDENGEPISGTVMTALLSEYFLKEYPGATILYNAICGRVVPETILAHGGKPVRTRVGHSFIKADMRTHNAVFAGEHTGHYFFKKNYMADSGLIAAIIALSLLSNSKTTMSELVKPYQTYIQITETNFTVADKESAIKKIAEAFAGEKQDMLDGLTVNFANSWFNVRPSNTEPVMRLNAEAKTQEELDTLVAKVTALIN
jgi:phosphomannomutase